MRLRTLTPLVLVSLVLGADAANACPAVPHRDQPAYCAYTDHDVNKFHELERQLGTTLDCAVVFSDAVSTWEDWENPWYLRVGASERRLGWTNWANGRSSRRLVITHSLLPSSPPADWRERGAEGEYDAHARTLARNLVNAGLGDSVIRLAHEPNGTWFHHSVGETPQERRQWARFWARTVRTMRSVEGASFRFDLSVNAAVRPIPLEEYYPGDDVVDIIGIDQYDSCPGECADTSGAERWRTIKYQVGGLAEITDFAREHGKPISIPETGLVAEERDGAGDDPTFVRGLRAHIAANDVEYVAYFDKNVGGTLRLEEVPRSFQIWKMLFRRRS